MVKDLSLPEKLKRLRLANGYSQAYVASKLNISRQAYQHYESGRRLPNNEYLQLLANLYNLQIYDFIISDIKLDFSNLISEEPVYPKSVAEMEQKLLKAFRKLNEKDRQLLLKYAEAMTWQKK